MINILQGYLNLFLFKISLINNKKKELYKKRYSICLSCKELSKQGFCNICGCYMKAKTKVKNASCPKNLW